MKTIGTSSELRELRETIAASGQRVGFVPTMGALHEGHLSLVRRSKAENNVTIVSVFVNPTQFGPDEDFDKYPRTLEADSALLEKEGVDFLFAPEAKDIYPDKPLLTMDIPQMSTGLCGAKRPGHFNGVLLVVSKLFILVRPHRAYFGKKDYQQLTIIRQMTKDLSLGVEVIGCEIVREKNGLALSSRNLYLSEPERRVAVGLSASLLATKGLFEGGERNSEKLIEHCKKSMETSGICRIDYVALCDKITLLKMPEADTGAVLLAAVYVGNTRLIDNLEF